MAYTFKHGDRPIEGYTIQRAVGKGGFGEVYYAVSDGGREVAIKYLRDNPQIELRGVSNCINLKSPHLVSIFDVKKTIDGEYAIIMEYCSGPSLRDLLVAEPNGFGPQKAAFFLREIAKGLSYLHDRGIVHRDLKPGNIFYDDGYVMIGDYGLSKFISVSRHSGQTASVGTVHYMAPEIGSGNYSKGVDIYALGVMLYEMLLGKVPFEGSSMAEVLMKHLTAQPELDELPEPFGHVIRKALEKDPKDRYQSSDEMVDELLEVATVRESLAGFSAKSLDGAVRRGMPEGADSPMPSPNPAPGYARDFAKPVGDAQGQPPFAKPVGPPVGFPDRLAKRVERISRKVDAKLAKLGGKTAPQARQTPAPPPPPPAPAAAPQTGSGSPAFTGPPSTPALPQSDRKKRIAFSALLSIGLAVGLGILMGNWMGDEAYGIGAGALVVTMSGGIVLARSAVRWFGIAYGPHWPRQLIQLCCCAPIMVLGATPLFDKDSEEGAAIWLGLVVVAMFFKEGEQDSGTTDRVDGEIKFGRALWTAFGALIFTAIASEILGVRNEEHTIFLSAGVAGVVSLIIQASSWWFAAPAARAFQPPGFDRHEDGGGSAPPLAPAAGVDGYAPTSAGMAADPAAAEPGLSTHPHVRWGITRAFWGLVAFGLMGGAIVTFLVPLVATNVAYGDVTGAIIGCTACASFMLFALRKTCPVKREGFWRETMRPFLIAVAMSGIGATITLIAREWDYHSCGIGLCAGGRAASITGLAMCSVAFLGLLLFTGRKPRLPRRTTPTDAFASCSPDYCTPDGSAPCADQTDVCGATADHPIEGVEPRDLAQEDSRPRRRGITRVIWGVISFGLLCGANATFVIPLVGGFEHHDVTASVISCTGFAAFALFALRKTTRFKREAFWLETLRPFLLSLMLFGIGGTITGIAREWDHTYHDEWSKTVIERVTEEGRIEMAWDGDIVACVDDEGRVALIAGLVMCSVTFLALLFVTGRKPRPRKPFVLGGSGGTSTHDAAAPGAAAPEAVSLDRSEMALGQPQPAGSFDKLGGFVETASGLNPHRGISVLVLGILGISLFPLGIAAWIMGHNDLLEMEAGRMDPSGRGMTSAGKICGIISVIIACTGTIIGLITAAAAAIGAF